MLKRGLFFFVILLSINTIINANEKSDHDRLYQKLVQALQDKEYEQIQKAFLDYMKFQQIDCNDNTMTLCVLCGIYLYFDRQEEIRHLIERCYSEKKDDPILLSFFSQLNTNLGNYEKAIDDMTNAIVAIEKEPQKFLSQYKHLLKTPNISDQTFLNMMLGQDYIIRASLYAAVKNTHNARIDMKKAENLLEMPNNIMVLFYENLDKMEQSPNSISFILEKKHPSDYIVITNNIIDCNMNVQFKWHEKLPDIPLFIPPTQTPSLPVVPTTPQFEIPEFVL
jgi:hypothetical protein